MPKRPMTRAAIKGRRRDRAVARKGPTRDNKITNRLVRKGKLPRSQMENTSSMAAGTRSITISLPKGAKPSRRLIRRGATKIATPRKAPKTRADFSQTHERVSDRRQKRFTTSSSAIKRGVSRLKKQGRFVRVSSPPGSKFKNTPRKKKHLPPTLVGGGKKRRKR